MKIETLDKKLKDFRILKNNIQENKRLLEKIASGFKTEIFYSDSGITEQGVFIPINIFESFKYQFKKILIKNIKTIEKELNRMSI